MTNVVVCSECNGQNDLSGPNQEAVDLKYLCSCIKKASISLTENCTVDLVASVCVWYFTPKSTYLGVGKFGRKHIEDFPGRKWLSEADTKSWKDANL
jgi:hypothetical protein